MQPVITLTVPGPAGKTVRISTDNYPDELSAIALISMILASYRDGGCAL